MLNQPTLRVNPGVVHVSGYAAATACVLVNDQPCLRDGGYYYAAVPVSNGASATVKQITVCITERTADSESMTELMYKVIVPKASETTSQISHDDRGNLLTDSRYDYTWDLKNRLQQIETNSSVTDNDAKLKLEFDYDPLDRRTHKRVYSWDAVGAAWQLDETIKFVWDGWLLLAELDGSNDLLRSYIWGLDKSGTLQGAGGIGGLLAVVDHTGMSAETYWTTCDHNGNVMGLVDATDQSVVAAYEYSPYGQLLTADGPKADLCKLLFSTKYYDSEVGLCYYGYRYYAPNTGTWLNRDPIAEDGGFNLYGFVGNDPVNACDPTGLAEWWLKAGIVEIAESVAALVDGGFGIKNAPWPVLEPLTDGVFPSDRLQGKFWRHAKDGEGVKIVNTPENQADWNNAVDRVKNLKTYQEYKERAIEEAKNSKEASGEGREDGVKFHEDDELGASIGHGTVAHKWKRNADGTITMELWTEDDYEFNGKGHAWEEAQKKGHITPFRNEIQVEKLIIEASSPGGSARDYRSMRLVY